MNASSGAPRSVVASAVPACAADPELMFPPGEDSATSPPAAAQVAAAKAVCTRCPLLPGCREWALRVVLPYGVAGGMSAGERRRVRAARQLREPAPPSLLRVVVSAPVAAVVARHAGADGVGEVDEVVVARLVAGGQVASPLRWEVALAAVAMLAAGRSTAVVARVLGVQPRQVQRWRARDRAGQALIPASGRRSGAGTGAVA